MRRTRPQSTRATLGAFALVAVIAAGCGDKQSGATSTPPDATTAVTDAAVESTAGSETTATTVSAPDTTVADNSRDGEVIKIGYANNEGALFAVPEFRIGGEAAIDHINANGGVNGATIEVVECLDDGTPESAINCANKFIDEGVSMYYAGLDFSADAAVPVLKSAGIPLVSTHGWSLPMLTSENTFLLHSAYVPLTDGALKLFSDLGLKKVTQVLGDSADIHTAYENETVPLAEKLGLTVTPVFMPATASPDYNAAIQTAIADGAEAIAGGGSEEQCTALIQAARAARFEGVIAVNSCTQFIGALGKDAVGVYTVMDQWASPIADSAPQQAKDDIALYEQAMTDAGHADKIISFALAPFSAWMELRTILSTISGPIDAASVTAALAGANDSPGFAGPNLQCGVNLWPSQPNFCRASVIFQQVQDGPNGPAATPIDGEFIDMTELAG